MADLNPIDDDTLWPDKSNNGAVANRALQMTAEDSANIKARFTEIFTEVGIGASPPAESIKGRLALAAIKGPIRIIEDANATVTAEDNGGLIVMALATPDVIRTVTFPSSLPLKFEVTVVRTSVNDPAGGGSRVQLIGSGAGTHVFLPKSELVGSESSITAYLSYKNETEGDELTSWKITGDGAPQFGGARLSATPTSVYVAENHSYLVNTLRGNASGFTASAIIKMIKNRVADQEIIFGNHRQFNNDGGWYIGIDSERFKFGVGNNSDGSMAEAAGTDTYQMLNYWRAGGLMGKEFLLTLVYDGTTARFYVNGIEVKTLTPTSGLRISDSALYPMAGRGNNAGAPAVLTSAAIRQLAYKESVMTADQVSGLYESSIYRDAMAFADWTSLWNANDAGEDMSMVVGSITLEAPGDPVGSLRARTKW